MEVIERALAEGVPTKPLPEAVFDELRRRRREFKYTGWTFYERRNR